MINFLAIFLALAAAYAFAQPAPQTPANSTATGSISGVIRDAATGKELEDVSVAVSDGPTRKSGRSDARGRYSLSDLAAGRYRVSAIASSLTARGFGPRASRYVSVNPGQDLTAFDLAVQTHAEITGKVVDNNKEPIPGVSVYLVAREYSLGTLRYILTGGATSDDQGEYSLDRLQPGRPYLLLAQNVARLSDPISKAPLNPKLRRPAVVPTYYPNVTSLEAAQPVVFRPGEKRDGVDFQIARSPSYCIDGTVRGIAGPAAFRFLVASQRPHSGRSADGGGFYTSSSGSVTGPDGKYRVCDLPPGDYQFTVYPDAPQGALEFWGYTLITITNRDIENLLVPAVPRVPISGEVTWDGAPPDPPIPATLSLSAEPLNRTGRTGDPTPKSSIPGEFSFEGGVLMDDYELQIRGIPRGTYLKDVTYAGRSILYEPLRAGSAIGGSALKLLIAHDGATVNVKVAERDGIPVADANIVILPLAAANEAAVAARMVTGHTDQNGVWTSGHMAPGKYYAIAVRSAVSPTPEIVSKLWNARNRAEAFELLPKGSAQLDLRLVSLE